MEPDIPFCLQVGHTGRPVRVGARPPDPLRGPDKARDPQDAGVEAHPPLGEFHGIEGAPPATNPTVVLHTTSGTTGRPQPPLFGPQTREMQNLLLARAYLLQGFRDDDVVHSVYGHGLVNGGRCIRETVLHSTGALFVSAGTGVETRSRTQVELMRDFAATVLEGFIGLHPPPLRQPSPAATRAEPVAQVQ